EAFTGETAGQVLSCETGLIPRCRSPSVEEKATSSHDVLACMGRTSRSRRPCARGEVLCAEPGRSHPCPDSCAGPAREGDKPHFHCGWAAYEGNPERPSAPAAAVPARRARRETKLSFIVRSPWRSASSHGILAPARPLQQPDYDDTQLLRFRQAPSGHPIAPRTTGRLPRGCSRSPGR